MNYHRITEESRSKKSVREKPPPPKPGQESCKKSVESQKPVEVKYIGMVGNALF